MNALESFPWPKPPKESHQPFWNGTTFVLGDKTSRVLAYTEASSHWSEDLTSLHEQEAGRDHPIDMASRELAVHSMKRLEMPKPLILDVGCSSGFVLEELEDALPGADLIGADYLRGPLEGLSIRMPTIPILQFDLRHCPLPSACVNGITCLNVLEHIDEDEAALREIYRLLKPGGIAHVEVPAGPELYDIYDEHLLHHRRYRLSDLDKLTRNIGFSVEKGTHLGFWVHPAFALVKRGNRKKLKASDEEKKRLVASQIRSTRSNPVFRRLIRLETWLGNHLSYPCGIRCVIVLRKK